jgi:hypothetical protein
MKKLAILLIISSILIVGCKDTKTIDTKRKVAVDETTETYKDSNNTPIGIYSLENNNLKKLTTITKHLNVEEDIGIFQVYLSNEDNIQLTTNFGESFHNEWLKYQGIKLGFNIKYTLNNNETTSYNILSPDNTFEHWEYLMNYLYDDYANRNKSFYSHIESTDYNSETLFTAIKMQSSGKCNEIKTIELTAFTYDSEDDFLNNEYRGNSKATLIINTN